jgi:nucleoside-diphosphate-sugar epimerase
MNIYITGATGFVGSHLCNAAIQKGHKVFGLRYDQTQSSITIDDRLIWIDDDIMSSSFSIPEEADVVIHAAAIGVSPQTTTWEKGIQVNTVGTLNVFKAAKRANIKNMLTIGSILETGASVANKHGSFEPVGIYSTTKAAGFIIATGFARTHCLNLITVRLTNVYGEGQFENNIFPSLKTAALNGSDFTINNGNTIRNFIAIEKVCSEILKEIDSFSRMENTIKNIVIGDEADITVYEFASYWWCKWGAVGRLDQV